MSKLVWLFESLLCLMLGTVIIIPIVIGSWVQSPVVRFLSWYIKWGEDLLGRNPLK